MRWSPVNLSRVVFFPCVVVDDALSHMLKGEIRVPSMICRSKGQRIAATSVNYPVMRVTSIFSTGRRLDKLQQLPPLRLQCVGNDLEPWSKIGKPRYCRGIESNAILAEVINAKASEDQSGPTCRFFDFAIALPYSPRTKISNPSGRINSSSPLTFCF
jgi:hypothetical protein